MTHFFETWAENLKPKEDKKKSYAEAKKKKPSRKKENTPTQVS